MLAIYITDFICFSKKDQNMISDDANDDTIFTQDNIYKLKGINEVSSTSIIKTIFRHLAIETIRNFANFISSSIV